MTNMTKKDRGFEKISSPGCAPTLVILPLNQRYVVLVLRVVVPGGGGSSGWGECRRWSGGGWSGGGGTPAAGAAPRKAALDAGIVVHLAQKKVVRGVMHILYIQHMILVYILSYIFCLYQNVYSKYMKMCVQNLQVGLWWAGCQFWIKKSQIVLVPKGMSVMLPEMCVCTISAGPGFCLYGLTILSMPASTFMVMVRQDRLGIFWVPC